MLYKKASNEAIAHREQAVHKYNATYTKHTTITENLYNSRKDAINLVKEIECLLNSIAKTPKEFAAPCTKSHHNEPVPNKR